MFVVEAAIDESGQLLEVLLGLVEGFLEQAQLLELVGPPRPLVGEHQDPQGIVDRVRDDGQERADALVAHVSLSSSSSFFRCFWPSSSAALSSSPRRCRCRLCPFLSLNPPGWVVSSV